MRPLAILAAALVALYMLGRTSQRRAPGPAPDDIDWLAEYRAGNSWTFPLPHRIRVEELKG